VVDTLGLILAVVVHSAAVQDRDGALAVLAKLLLPGFPRLRLIWADGGYAGRLVRFLDRWQRALGWVLQIVKRSDDAKGFVVLPKRWIVERTFGWFGRYRRLSKDYEEQTRNSETMIRLAMINLMLHRLKPG
jgi:putative transposase